MQLHINIDLIDSLRDMHKYAKYLREVVARKKIQYVEFNTDAPIEECSLRVLSKLPKNLKGPMSFTLPYKLV